MKNEILCPITRIIPAAILAAERLFDCRILAITQMESPDKIAVLPVKIGDPVYIIEGLHRREYFTSDPAEAYVEVGNLIEAHLPRLEPGQFIFAWLTKGDDADALIAIATLDRNIPHGFSFQWDYPDRFPQTGE